MNKGIRTAPGVGGTIVVLAAWCSQCKDETMPSDLGYCAWCGRKIVDFDLLKAKDAIASTNTNGGTPMSTAVGTARCKREGCDEPAEDMSGPYAKLCTGHKQEARESRAATPRPAVSRSSTGGGTSSLADLAKKILPAARKVDRARAQLVTLPSRDQAKVAFDEATRRASAVPSVENLDRVSETLKALQQGAPRRTRVENDVAHAERELGLALQALARAANAA